VRVDGTTEIWVKQLSGNRAAVLLLNRDASATRPVTLRASDVGFSGKWTVRDLFARQDLGTAASTLTKSTPPHAGWFLLISR
jgi:alpha-galactosidase